MSLSQKNLSSIQKAGQSTHNASEAIAATIRAQAQSVVASVATQPFGAESEQSISRFKMLARLSQGLISVETQLRELFAIATELASPASDVVIGLSYAAKHKISNAAAVDVVVNPPKAPKGAKRKSKGKRVPKAKTHTGSVTANDTALLQYLQSVLKSNEPTRITGGVMATGSGLPLGSIGVSLKKILASGAVTSSARGLYQLGGSPVNPDATSVEKTKPVKKAKASPAKKSKFAVESQNLTSDA